MQATTNLMGLTWRRALVAGLVCAGLAFMAYLAWSYRREIVVQLASADLALAAAALGSLLASTLGIAIVFSELVNDETSPANPNKWRLLGTYLLSQVAKYVPGRVWGAVLQGVAVGPSLSIQCLLRINIDLSAMAAVVTLGSAFAFVAWTAYGAWAGGAALVLTAVANCLVMVQRPSIRLQALLGRYFPRFRMTDADSARARRGRVTALGVFGAVLFLAGYCVGWLALVMAFTGGSFAEGLRLTAMVSLSYLVGLVSMLPAGLGVREAFLLASSAWLKMDMAAVTLVAIVTRLAMVAVDLLSVPIAGVLLMIRRTPGTLPR